MQLIAKTVLIAVDWDDMEVLAGLYGCKKNELEKCMATMTANELGTFMLDCAPVGNVKSDYVHHTPDALMAAAKHYGVNPSQIRKQLEKPQA